MSWDLSSHFFPLYVAFVVFVFFEDLLSLFFKPSIFVFSRFAYAWKRQKTLVVDKSFYFDHCSGIISNRGRGSLSKQLSCPCKGTPVERDPQSKGIINLKSLYQTSSCALQHINRTRLKTYRAQEKVDGCDSPPSPLPLGWAAQKPTIIERITDSQPIKVKDNNI